MNGGGCSGRVIGGLPPNPRDFLRHGAGVQSDVFLSDFLVLE